MKATQTKNETPGVNFPRFWPLGRTDESPLGIQTTRYYEVVIHGKCNGQVEVVGRTKLTGWNRTASFKVVFECSSFDGSRDADAIRSALREISIQTASELSAWDSAFQAIVCNAVVMPTVVRISQLASPRRRPSDESLVGFVADYVAAIRDHFVTSLANALDLSRVEVRGLKN